MQGFSFVNVGIQRCPNQLAFATNGHAAKSFEPPAHRDLGCDIKPLRKLAELVRRNFAGTDAIKQMIEESWRQVAPADFRHRARRHRSRGQWSPGRAKLPGDPLH
jgi:hypothetical protein